MHGRVLRSFALPLAVAIAAWIPAASWLAQRLIVEHWLDRADAILVLAGSGSYVERTETAAFLFREHLSARILLTNDGVQAGWSPAEDRIPSFVELARLRLISKGVPADAIEILPQLVSGTMEEAELIRYRAASSQWSAIMIVTSATHTRRAIWTFERAFDAKGLHVTFGIAPARIDGVSFQTNLWWLTSEGWKGVAGEYIKWAYYALAY
jgi:uncharacterized SAM-binding protein YcdF (DUF218 family)